MRFLFGPPAIPADERKVCIEYYKLELLLKLLQDVEDENYKKALGKYRDAPEADKVAGVIELSKAAKRMAAAARSILDYRKAEMPTAPEAGALQSSLGQDAHQKLSDWADAVASGLDVDEEGCRQFSIRDIGVLLGEAKEARKKAEREEKTFLRRLKLSKLELLQITALDDVEGTTASAMKESIVASTLVDDEIIDYVTKEAWKTLNPGEVGDIYRACLFGGHWAVVQLLALPEITTLWDNGNLAKAKSLIEVWASEIALILLQNASDQDAVCHDVAKGMATVVFNSDESALYHDLKSSIVQQEADEEARTRGTPLSSYYLLYLRCLNALGQEIKSEGIPIPIPSVNEMESVLGPETNINPVKLVFLGDLRAKGSQLAIEKLKEWRQEGALAKKKRKENWWQF